ncbi:MAG: hypothetical protein K6L76_09815 [Agarilytica sp.]
MPKQQNGNFLKQLITISFLATLSCVMIACAHTPKVKISRTDITFEEPNRMRFHGKGAGAGMMMMSSMGPMGIAIGVAIDEGIGKEIGEAANKADFDLASLLVAGLAGAAQQIESIHVKRYGFVTRRGENDPVAPQLHLEIQTANGVKEIKYPEAFDDAKITTHPLEQLKAQGATAIKAFENAIQVIAQQ